MWKVSLLFLSLLVVIAIASGFIPVSDYDFFWHLKTGEWIWQNKKLPETDPFLFPYLTSDRTDQYRPRTILRSYWLSQLLFYGIYDLSGFKGVIVFRAVIFCIILLILWHTMGRLGVDYRVRTIFLMPYLLIIGEYQKERPQLFSFLFAPLVIYLLDELKQSNGASIYRFSPASVSAIEGKTRRAYSQILRYCSVPAIMLLWANTHGGFLVGIAFIIAYLFSEWLLYMIRGGNAPLRFTFVCVIGVISTFFNPNTYHTIASFFLFYQGLLPEVTVEFLSPIRLYSKLSIHWYSYWFLLILTILVFIIRVKKLSITEGFILIGTAVASLSAIRFVFFFFVAVIPVIARHANSLITDIARGMSFHLRLYVSRIITYGLLIVLFIFIYTFPVRNIPLKGDVLEDIFPVEAASFLEKNDLPNLIFNDVAWGGYLIWRLYPGYKVFIDTRTLNIDVFRQYYSVLDASQKIYAGMPEWKGILKAYKIDMVFTPLTDRYTGETLPFIIELLKDKEWALIYMDRKASIFLRRTTDTDKFIKEHSLDKEVILYRILRINQNED